MAYLLDTSVLLRLVNASDINHPLAVGSLVTLRAAGEALHVTAQNMVEFRGAATRPTTAPRPGLGMSLGQVDAEIARIEAAFALLPEVPAIYPAWKALATAAGVQGKQVHDARLAAVCHAHGVSHLLTFNDKDFRRFASLPPGLTVVHPRSV